MRIREYLKENVLIADGAMGTYFSKIKNDDMAVSEWANLAEPDLIEKVHREYIKAGARFIRTNTFAVPSTILGRQNIGNTGSEQEIDKIVREGIRIARKAVRKEGLTENQDIFIAGSIGPAVRYAQEEEVDLTSFYQHVCDLFIEEQIHVILFETLDSLYDVREVLHYVKQKSDVYTIVSFCLNKNGFTSMGISANRLALEAEEGEDMDAYGFNCGIGPGHMNAVLKRIDLKPNKPVFVMPNAGYPEQQSKRMVFQNNSNYFADYMKEIKTFPVSVLGGCCGTTPDYIRKLSSAVPKGPCVSMACISDRRRPSKPGGPKTENAFYRKLCSGQKVIAVELDPPFDADYEKMVEQAHSLKEDGADLITMADSPMGRSRVDSVLMGVKLMHEADVGVMPHICCRDKNMIAMRSMLLGAYIHNIRNLLIVTGDPVPSISRTLVTGVFDYSSIQLMEFVKEMNREHFSREPFYYGGALNYARGKIDKISDRMKRKIEAGASYFLTQPVYSKEDMERVARLRDMTGAKILCGIMPLVSYRNARFVKNEISGICVPDEVFLRYHPDMSREEGEQTGVAVAGEIIKQMASAADGYYFMLPFNRVGMMKQLKAYL